MASSDPTQVHGELDLSLMGRQTAPRFKKFIEQLLRTINWARYGNFKPQTINTTYSAEQESE